MEWLRIATEPPWRDTPGWTNPELPCVEQGGGQTRRLLEVMIPFLVLLLALRCFEPTREH